MMLINGYLSLTMALGSLEYEQKTKIMKLFTAIRNNIPNSITIASTAAMILFLIRHSFLKIPFMSRIGVFL